MGEITKPAAIAFALALGGCAARTEQTIPIGQLSSAMRDIKRQLFIYEVKASAPYSDKIVLNNSGAGGKSIPQGCGNGKYRILVTDVNLNLVTSSSDEVAVGVGGTLPVSAVFLSPSLSVGVTQASSQELSIHMLPVSDSRTTLSDEEKSAPAPIADQLLSIRDSLVVASRSGGKCLAINNASPTGNTYTIGISAVRVSDAKIGFDLAPIDISASGQNKSTTGNQITVKFAEVGPEYSVGTRVPPIGKPFSGPLKPLGSPFKNIILE